MRATAVLQKCLHEALDGMHALRARALLNATLALIAGRRLTLMDVARSWPGAERVRAPLKALDRLLGNRHLHAERERIYAGMARWLLRSPRPVIVVDWSDLKRDGSWFLLRAAVPVGGRSLPILDMVFPAGQQGTPIAERLFLRTLRSLVPATTRPILVTDAGFRIPWFRAVEDLGWYWVGRLRHRTQVKPIEADDVPDQWVPCKALYALVLSHPRDLGVMHTAASQAWPARLVLHGRPAKGRVDRTRRGQRARSKHSLQNARREREPWILVASPTLVDTSAARIVAIYAQRMQIELSFRDLKSHRFGNAFEDSLTRKGPRIAILLLLHAMAAFATWLVGLSCEASGLDRWLAPFAARRRLYSVVRLGREALLRRWPYEPLHAMLDRMRHHAQRSLDPCCSSA
jgi:hypothetical protein